MKKKVLLVNPNSSKGYIPIAIDIFSVDINDMVGKKGFILPTVLGTIAALTPPEFEVTIIDEQVGSLNFNEQYDIVGITGIFSQLPRAREIAKLFSKRGALVVCGGSSVTLAPERWRDFADVLLIGEAERIWPEFLADYLSGRHKPEYRELEKVDLSLSPIPDFSGMAEKSRGEYLVGLVQTSRGCPFNCEFCSVHVLMGHKMRYKSPARVIQEIDQLYEMGLRYIFLADDNFCANRITAMAILTAMRDWNRAKGYPLRFAAQLSLNVVKDSEFLTLASEAGLVRAYVGIESPNAESLKEANKSANVKRNLIEDLKVFSRYGIRVWGSIIVGFDHDDLSIFQQQLDFLMKTGIPRVYVYALFALDGTRLKENMIKEGRYIDWDLGDSLGPSIIPGNMTTDQVKQGVEWLYWNLYKSENLVRRLKTFFEDYANSPEHGPVISFRKQVSVNELKLIWRLVRHLFTKASKEERATFRQLWRHAWKSYFPRLAEVFEIIIAGFFFAKKVQDTMMQTSRTDGFPYPLAEPGAGPEHNGPEAHWAYSRAVNE